MRLLIVSDDIGDVLLSIENVNHPPYGIDTVPTGVALSPVLRGELTKFFYENPAGTESVVSEYRAVSRFSYAAGNYVTPKVVQFKKR